MDQRYKMREGVDRTREREMTRQRTTGQWKRLANTLKGKSNNIEPKHKINIQILRERERENNKYKLEKEHF